jgi:chromosome segregation ATPase
MVGMVPVAPGADDKSTAGAFAILGVVGNDNKFNQRLKELTDLAQTANDALKTANAAKVDAEQRVQLGQQKLNEASKLHNETLEIKAAADQVNKKSKDNVANVAIREAALVTDRQALEKEMTKVKTAYDNLAKTAADLSAREKALVDARIQNDAAQAARTSKQDARDDALKARENAAAAAEKKANDLAASIAQQQADWVAKVAKLRALVE